MDQANTDDTTRRDWSALQRTVGRLGYVAWRCVDAATGEVLACKALGELLRWIAAQVPRQLGSRNFQ